MFVVVSMHTDVRCFFFFKQKTAYEMRISDWSSDVCSSDLTVAEAVPEAVDGGFARVARGRIVAAQVGARAVGRRAILIFGGQVQIAIEIGRASCRERVCQYV